MRHPSYQTPQRSKERNDFFLVICRRYRAYCRFVLVFPERESVPLATGDEGRRHGRGIANDIFAERSIGRNRGVFANFRPAGATELVIQRKFAACKQHKLQTYSLYFCDNITTFREMEQEVFAIHISLKFGIFRFLPQ